MKLLKYVVSTLLFVSAFTASAADISLGIRAGGNYNFDTIFAGDYEGLLKNSDFPMGFEGAITGQFDFLRLGPGKVGLTTDIGFEFMNGVHADKQVLRNTWSESGLGLSTYDKVKTLELSGMAIEFAPLISYSIPVSKTIKIIPFVGPVVSYNLQVQEKSSIEHYEKDGSNPETLVSTTNSVINLDNFLSYGIQFGLGSAFEMGPGSLTVDGRYGFDFKSDGFYRKGGATLSVGYLFNISKDSDKPKATSKKAVKKVEKSENENSEGEKQSEELSSTAENSENPSSVTETGSEKTSADGGISVADESTPVEVKKSSVVITVNNYFTPDDDGVNDVLKINNEVLLEKNKAVKEWNVEITDARGKIVKTWSGTDLPGTLEFDGKYPNGTLVSSCSDYIVNTNVKISGNKILNDSKVVRTGIMVSKEDNYLRINIPGIVFDSEGAGFETLTKKQKKENERIFTELADVLKKYSGYKITIEGHTTNFSGKESDENEKYIPMTVARAEAVKKALAEKGVGGSIKCEGKGGTVPISTGSFAWKNRRIEIRLEK